MHQHAKCAARGHQADTWPDTCPELRRGLSEDAENYQADRKFITRAWLGYAAAGRDLRRRPTTLPETVTLLKENSFTSTASSSTTRTSADSTTFTSDMAAAPAPVSLLDGMLNRLETYVKAGTSAQFLKLTGDLVSDASPEALSKAVWSGSDPPGPAALGGLRCLLGKPEISAVADWANVIPTGGGQGFLNAEARWFEVHGFGLATKIAQTALISTGAPGGGQVTAAMADGRELMYLDIVREE